jgi:hypothetical protein
MVGASGASVVGGRSGGTVDGTAGWTGSGVEGSTWAPAVVDAAVTPNRTAVAAVSSTAARRT